MKLEAVRSASCEGEEQEVWRPDPISEPEAPLWRREPYRVLFPLGIALSWVGVGKWLLLAAWGIGSYASAGHAITQVQGFLMCFAAGFLLTAIPRRTGGAPASVSLVALAALAPTITTITANAGAFGPSQLSWFVLVAALVTFAVRRMRGGGGARRRPPNAFVWIPVSFLLGATGAVLMALRALGPDWIPLHDLGKDLLVQGLFVGLILGVGSLVLPLITRGEGPPDASPSPADRRARAAHLAAALGLVASFALERWVDVRAGMGLRAAITIAVFTLGARLHVPPRLPGLNRRLVWVAAWCVPAGFVVAAIDPTLRLAALHLTFVGGFATLALGVGMHVALTHADEETKLARWPWRTVLVALLLGLATVLRLLMAVDPARLWTWMALSSGAFLLAGVAWLALVGPRLARAPA